MKLKWDFHELFDFGERIADLDKFEKICRKVTVQLAKELQEMLFNKTPVKTGQLAAGWGGAENYSYKITKLKNAYKIELINRVPYALNVNDGHYSYNQYNKGGTPYDVKNRVKVPNRSEYDTLDINESKYVFGHFFVEASIAELENGKTLENVLYKELEKWFRWCVNG
jgi:hypothetical protein